MVKAGAAMRLDKPVRYHDDEPQHARTPEPGAPGAERRPEATLTLEQASKIEDTALVCALSPARGRP